VEMKTLAVNPYLPVPARCIKIVPQTELEKIFRFEFIDKTIQEKFDYLPGQFLELSIPGFEEAPFSITSTPTRNGYFEFCVRNVGTLTRALHNLKEGEKVGIRGPFGNGFPLNTLRSRNILVIAGGLGFIPLRSLINYIIDKRDEFGDLKILYGTKQPKELLFRDELKAWEERNDIELITTVDEVPEGQEWSGNIGVVTTLIPKVDIHKDYTAVICGPPIMYKFVLKELDGKLRENLIFLSLERRMRCGIGKCGHCAIGPKYACLDGPVFSYEEIKNLQGAI
jgi:sulfhydrogenase subunit gamma (sulfur reductase)